MCHLLLFLGGLIAEERLVRPFLPSSAVRVVVLLQWVLVVVATAICRGVLLAPAHCWVCCRWLIQSICRQLHFTRLYMFTRLQYHLFLTSIFLYSKLTN
jgi:hypothetical protein